MLVNAKNRKELIVIHIFKSVDMIRENAILTLMGKYSYLHLAMISISSPSKDATMTLYEGLFFEKKDFYAV